MTEPNAKPVIVVPRLLEEEPEVSYTAYKRWQECNFQEALLRLGPAIIPRAPKDRRNFLVGNVVHTLLREHVIPHRRPAEPRRIEDTFDVESAKPGMRFRSTEDRPALLAKAIRVMDALTPPLLSLLKHTERVAVEAEIRRRLPDAAGSGWFWMQGVLDLVVTLRDGRQVILDFKTSQSFDRLQLVWYAAIWMIGEPDVAPTSLAFLAPANVGVAYRLEPLKTDSDEMMAVVYEAARMALALKGGVFPSNPSHYRCKECRVRGSCADSAYQTNRGRSSVH